MNSTLDKFLPLLGRALIALLFIPAGLSKIMGFSGTVAYIASVGLPLAALGAVLAIVVELGGGLALLVGWKARWVALALALFSVASALFFHKFWAVPPEQVMAQTINFYKNFAIAGGLLFVVAFGAGAWSLDARGAQR
ncbi:DoxX family protein [Rivibacter subsaxonicus]|uniref:Putative oxidoreductase n=1 Tax=Rivibacter subsaxonicus TaxID=457575 RepID=A0A4Q7W0W7_9BURK|nr:DoxX family protein [Rivibacter subsaxonicus]RZU02760.1 putative oxidoreductase [Rivibacter subsaxonicus]